MTQQVALAKHVLLYMSSTFVDRSVCCFQVASGPTLCTTLVTMRNNNAYKICNNLHLHRELADI